MAGPQGGDRHRYRRGGRRLSCRPRPRGCPPGSPDRGASGMTNVDAPAIARRTLSAADVAAAAQLACLLEASAPKPGNVSPGLHFHDTRYEDFLASAVAIGPAMAG